MTDTFDWAGLWSEAADIRYDHGDSGAAAYLRTRIEAAFVPVFAAKALMDEKHKEAAEAKLWFTKAQEWRQIAARAEAAEARVKVLEEALRWALPQANAHRPSCSLYDDDTCDCGDWNDKWSAARQALGAEHGK